MKETKKAIITLVVIIGVILLIPIALIVKGSAGNKILNELNAVMDKNELSLVYVGSRNCGYCELYNPIIEKVTKDNKVTYHYIDVVNLTQSQYSKLLDKFNKKSDEFGTPYTALVQKGKVVAELGGYVEAEELIEFLTENKYLDEENVVRDEVNLNMIGYAEYNTLINSDKNEVIVLASTTCSACLIAKPILDDIAKNEDITINYLNVNKLSRDDYSKLQDSFEMFSKEWSTPTILIVKDKEIIDKKVGADSKENYIKFFKDNALLK